MIHERHYGLRVGDTVEERAFGNVLRGVVIELPLDNNAAYIRTANNEPKVKVVAEWCTVVERPSDEKLFYLCDRRRHLICVPFSIENLHRMADELGIKRGWFDNGLRLLPSGRPDYGAIRHPHYDIPKRRIEEITAKCTVVSSKILYITIGDGVREEYKVRRRAEIANAALSAKSGGDDQGILDMGEGNRPSDER